MSLLRALLLSVVFICSAASANPTEVAARITEELAALPNKGLAEAELKAAQSLLEQAQTHIQTAEGLREELAALEQELGGLGPKIVSVQNDLAALNGVRSHISLKQMAALPLVEQEAKLAALSTERSELQRQQAEASSHSLQAQTRPERAQADIATYQARIQEITGILKAGRDTNRQVLTDASRLNLLAEQHVLEARIELERTKLAANSQLLDLANAEVDLLNAKLAIVERDSQSLETLVSERRRLDSQRAVSMLAQEIEQGATAQWIYDESAHNVQLSDQLLAYTEQFTRLNQRQLQSQRQLDSLTQIEQTLEDQLKVLEGNLLLRKVLNQQKAALPVVKVDHTLSDKIADIRLRQFDLNQEREQLNNPQSFIDNRLRSYSGTVTAEEKLLFSQLIETRVELLERLSQEVNALLNVAINLQLNQSQLKTRSDAIKATLDEQLFWIPSSRPLDGAWLKNVPSSIVAQINALPWQQGTHELISGLISRPLVFFPVIMAFALLLAKRRTLQSYVKKINTEVGSLKKDSQWHTPAAVLINMLLALPISLLLALAGYALLLDARGQNAHFGSALLAIALAWLVFNTAYRVLSPQGIAERHFQWPKERTEFLHKHIKLLGCVVTALVAVVAIAGSRLSGYSDDVLGTLVVIVCYALMGLFMFNLFLRGPDVERASWLTKCVGVAACLLPLAMLAAVVMGYYYTVLRLSDRLVGTLYALLIFTLLEAMLVRGLSVAAKRLAYARAMRKRQEQPTEGLDGEMIDEPQLDISQVNKQSLRLMRLGLYVVLIGVLYWIWADLISVMTYLNNVDLYTFTSASGSTTPVSLGDLLRAGLIAAIAMVLARNLPGLLEVMLLSRMSLAQGTNYAVTTLLSYVLGGAGIVLTLGTLGVSWDRLQWLVAALSVGIGFGMQEIFANFVSGLIILFERQIRIGDSVTIGGVTGTVKKIRIRATHIIDSDRKEVIVPNRIMVTSQLTNWTLSDTVTRVVLSIAINRGADLDLVRELLLKASQENPRVMREPQASVTVVSYSPSTLTHELKVYVKELSDRSLVADELNRRIDQLLAEHGINISGPQQIDLRMREPEPKPSAPTPQ